MSSAFEALGMSLPRSSTMAAEDSEKITSAEESAKILFDAVKKNLTPNKILTRNLLKTL